MLQPDPGSGQSCGEIPAVKTVSGNGYCRYPAGDPITARLTAAPGNGASIGGLKIMSEQGWFAARPSGTEDAYKIYCESFRGPEHLVQIERSD